MKDFTSELLAALNATPTSPVRKNRPKISVRFANTIPANGAVFTSEKPSRDTMEQAIREHNERVSEASPLVKSVFNMLNGGQDDSIERLAFEKNPDVNNTYNALYQRKNRLLPDEVLKRISIQDDLVAAIVNTRSQMVSAFGRPQPDRFSTGYVIEAEPGLVDKLDEHQKEKLQKQIERAEKILLTCGQTKGWADHKSITFASFLFQQARNAVVFGRCATEIIWVHDNHGEKKFHSFRPIDAGTIYQANPLKSAAQQVRENALHILERLANKRLQPERYVKDEYTWVQVIEGRPLQAFTNEECVVHNFYPCTDIELGGYPLTPLDTVISAVTTHINITTHNKLYFQSGRAARGMIVFKSDDISEQVVEPIRQQFMANINGVGNAWRMPIFGVGSGDDVTWQAIDGGERDMEFQYLSDTNARVILSAFQMSPEELPGYAHLSRGTNNQALSESNNEYKLEAHRDVGIRPLIAQMQNHINERLLPLIDPELAKIASIKFVGLDVDTAEKESARIQQDMAVHMTYDEVLDQTEKKPVGKEWGGQFPLNPQWQQALFQHRYVGDIMEHFWDQKGASKDPTLRFIRDPMWFQWQQMLMEQQQMQQQAQQQQQQAQQQQQQQQEAQGDLASATDQLIQSMSKSEAKLPPVKRALLEHQRKVISQTLEAFEAEASSVIESILADTEKLVPRK